MSTLRATTLLATPVLLQPFPPSQKGEDCQSLARPVGVGTPPHDVTLLTTAAQLRTSARLRAHPPYDEYFQCEQLRAEHDFRALHSGKSPPRTSMTAMAELPSAQVIQTRIATAANTGRLDLSNCGLEEVPPQVFALKDLEHLSLAWNNISHIPDSIENLKNLRNLGISGNWLVGLPPNISKLVQLESLWIQGNLLQQLPVEIGTLKNLSILNLTGNMLENIPETVGSLVNLNLLSLSANQLKQLPEGLGNLAALKILTLNGNYLQSLPMSLERLSLLEKLSIQGNRLENLPTNLTGLSSLKELTAADNELLDLPDSIGGTKCLQTLSLYGNRLARLPKSICSLKQLRSLWLECNPLEGLPESLLSASSLKALGVDSNLALPTTRSHGQYYSPLQICRLAGTGLVASQGGYFKLQSSFKTRVKVLVVAFGSAPGVPNWGGVLGRMKGAMLADKKTPAFDVLFVVDTRRSWFTETKSGKEWQPASSLGASPNCLSSADSKVKECRKVGAYYQQELHEAIKGYERVVMIGDSMGASAGLLFSPLATSVIAFCPQVDMAESAIRPGRGRDWFDAYKEELINAVIASSAHITVHCGSWDHDLYQAKLLPEKVKLVVHNSDSHRLSKELDIQGTLLNIVRKTVEEEIRAADSVPMSAIVAPISNI
ncbi:hypothetical protein GOP47_0028518 [Adiantum capillus-veneris]|nr:hypothetical protein GOP47_0028518 [Adiantum capillus-veneris]